MEPITLSLEMMVVLGLLGLTIFLFVSEIFRVDLSALLILVLLGVVSYLPGMGNVANINHIFDGFASNAVISIIAVMIIGAGLDRTGVMNKVAAKILKVGGTSEGRIVPIISASVGVISSFMQNVGAAALFLPVVSRISSRTSIPLSRMLMPMGFCAILGGTLTMVGSSPLILLNDLIASANETLPADQKMEPFSLFSVAPIGAVLIVTGILYFAFFGNALLPKVKGLVSKNKSVSDYVKRLYGIDADIFEVSIPESSLLVGHELGDIMEAHHFYIIGLYANQTRYLAPMLDVKATGDSRLAVMGRRETVAEFAALYGLEMHEKLEIFSEDFVSTNAGIGEIVIPPGSSMIGGNAKDLQFRKTYGLSLLAIYRKDEILTQVDAPGNATIRIGLEPLSAGDTLVTYSTWESLARADKDSNFVVITQDFPHELMRPHKVGYALFFFLLALGLILFSPIKLSLCLLVGAVGMIVSKVLSIDEAYKAVGWSTIFLLASLIPLGVAVQSTGTAEWIAQQVLVLMGGMPIWMLQVSIAILSTIFTLVMSNVGATVLLVPLAVSIAIAAGGDPAIFAMTVAISTSNSFLIPTHQVNALIMGPGGYKVMDFVRAGAGMTILFLVISITMMNLLW